MNAAFAAWSLPSSSTLTLTAGSKAGVVQYSPVVAPGSHDTASAFASVASDGGGVAFFAHVGGFLFGLAAIKLFANSRNEEYERPARLPVY